MEAARYVYLLAALVSLPVTGEAVLDWGVIPAGPYDALRASLPDGLAAPAFDFRFIDGVPVIVRGGDGIRAGWTILRIGSRQTSQILATSQIPAKVRAEASGENEIALRAYAELLRTMSGDAGDSKAMVFGLPDGTSVTCDVPLTDRGRARPDHGFHLTAFFRIESDEWSRGFVLDLKSAAAGTLLLPQSSR